MKRNLEIPSGRMAGIMNSNPFSLLHPDVLHGMANSIGVDIIEANKGVLDNKTGETRVETEIHEVVRPDDVSLSFNGNDKRNAGVAIPAVDTPPGSPRGDDLVEIDEIWTEVVRKLRGKHPRKKWLC